MRFAYLAVLRVVRLACTLPAEIVPEDAEILMLRRQDLRAPAAGQGPEAVVG
jgi:hypothetical protein